MIENIAYVNGAKITERRVNFFARLYPFAFFVRNSENIHNGKIIADHKVEAYRFFYSVEDSSVGSREYVDYSYDFSV